MDTDRPSSQLFFCFTSSSSSMKMSSKSVLSPGRAGYSREPTPAPIALSTSLSRRLSKSRSIRGAASPAMFPVTGKKRGSGFDNPEPSSPKVTCIGQVRVKARKKHAKNLRSLSTRRKLKHSRSQRQRINSTSNSNNNNQRWVHIPMTICEALRTFGSEVSCLFPCRSSTTPMENGEKSTGVGSARWVVALQDGEIEMVTGDDDGVEVRSVRRHVFNDLEIVNDVILGSNLESVDDVIPPKNALLLMRGRCDPVKMEALTNQFLEPQKHEVDFEDKGIEDLEVKDEKVMVMDEIIDSEEINLELGMEEFVGEEKQEMLQKQSMKEDDNQEQSMEINETEDDLEHSMEINEEEEEESFFIGNLFEENPKIEEEEAEEQEEAAAADFDMKDALELLFEDEYVEETETGESNIEQFTQLEEGIETEESVIEEVKQFVEEMLTEFTEISETGELKLEEIKHFEEGNEEICTQFTESYETEESKLEEVKHVGEEIEDMLTEFIARSETVESKTEEIKQFDEENEEILTEFRQISEISEREKIESLPECLLLMMYEPKLSMEVSKETWVCSNDFIRSRSSRKKPPPQPPIDESKVVGQTSCSIPASDSMIAMLEQKLVNTMGFEPLVLTRCKSEPMRRARETCCLQNQLEPPRRASFGVGMAGLAG